ncbi:sigma-70 family RNA polymerase sigma factor [Paenibacillus sp. FSL W8-1187]|uniref:sigma-70 family RNA polymerase sigma factor n=1 Tax=unclassified Paenibacillus TaxID=185978 RepID=UPI001E417E6F|nr:sigma-70 family RNA polymerase sigma factor [Paenibacillus sp. B01]
MIPLEPESKRMLARRAAAGDEEAFLELMDAERHRLRRIASACLSGEHDVLEAVQETACRAWLKRRELRQPDYMGTWLVRILLRVCADELKRSRRQPPSAEAAELLERRGREAAPLADEAGEADLRLDLAAVVDALEPPYRDVVRMKYHRDMTLTEIARALEKPPGTVKTWLHKALGQMRGQLRKGEEGKHGG